MTPLERDDPRLTEYVLNEMSDEERNAFEKQLESSPEIQAEIDELKETATLLDDGFSNQDEYHLNEERRAAVFAGQFARVRVATTDSVDIKASSESPGNELLAAAASVPASRDGSSPVAKPRGGGFLRLVNYGAVAACLALGLGIALKNEILPGGESERDPSSENARASEGSPDSTRSRKQFSDQKGVRKPGELAEPLVAALDSQESEGLESGAELADPAAAALAPKIPSVGDSEEILRNQESNLHARPLPAGRDAGADRRVAGMKNSGRKGMAMPLLEEELSETDSSLAQQAGFSGAREQGVIKGKSLESEGGFRASRPAVNPSVGSVANSSPADKDEKKMMVLEDKPRPDFGNRGAMPREDGAPSTAKLDADADGEIASNRRRSKSASSSLPGPARQKSNGKKARKAAPAGVIQDSATLPSRDASAGSKEEKAAEASRQITRSNAPMVVPASPKPANASSAPTDSGRSELEKLVDPLGKAKAGAEGLDSSALELEEVEDLTSSKRKDLEPFRTEARKKPNNSVAESPSVEQKKKNDGLLAPKMASAARSRMSQFKDRGESDRFEPLTDNPFLAVRSHHLSTISVDVDTASYAIARSYLTSNRLPPRNSVRIEEYINYFSYDYPQPIEGRPFSVNIEMADSPWNTKTRLVRIGLKGRDIDQAKRPRLNLVFLVDVSGSMQADDRLKLLQRSMSLLVDRLTEDDRVSIVTYANGSGVALDPTEGSEHAEIKAKLNSLTAGGSTNGSGGIEKAYELALENFDPDGVNRVILATDGDFNVGVTGRDALVNLVSEKAKTKVFLTVLGFGKGNLRDDLTEAIANKGDGNYFYIDSLEEGRKVLCEELSGTMITIAKDVKLQVAFNPLKVAEFRLIGYANRLLENKSFRNDSVDAGEIGGGHTVTAFYEIVPQVNNNADEVRRDFFSALEASPRGFSEDDRALLNTDNSIELRVTFKKPEATVSSEFFVAKVDDWLSWSKTSEDFRFAAAVAGFGMELRQSQFKGELTLEAVLELAQEGVGADESGRRKDFLQLVRKAIEVRSQLPAGAEPQARKE